MKTTNKVATVLMFVALACLLSLPPSLSAASKDKRIAMIVWRGETAAEKGFRDGLKELGYSAQITVFNAEQDRAKLAQMLRNDIQAKLDQYDYVYSFGTTASKMTRSIIKDQLPHIFNIVTDPMKAGIVKSMQSSGGNVSGISHRISLELQIKTALKVRQFKKLGIFFNPREKNTEIIRSTLNKIAKSNGFSVIEFRAAPGTDMLEKQLQEIINTPDIIDAVYLPTDSYIISRAKLIGEKLSAAKLMSIGSQKDFLSAGALIGVIPDYYQLGKLASTILGRHNNGEQLSNIPIETVKNPRLAVNEKTRISLKIPIPEALMKTAEKIE